MKYIKLLALTLVAAMAFTTACSPVGYCQRQSDRVYVCDKYTGSGWTESNAEAECKALAGNFNTSGCSDANGNIKSGRLGRCIVQEDGDKEKLQVAYTWRWDTEKHARFAESACISGGSKWEKWHNRLFDVRGD